MGRPGQQHRNGIHAFVQVTGYGPTGAGHDNAPGMRGVKRGRCGESETTGAAWHAALTLCGHQRHPQLATDAVATRGQHFEGADHVERIEPVVQHDLRMHPAMVTGRRARGQWPDGHGAPVYCQPMHRVAVLAEPDAIAFDLAIGIEVFGRVRLANGEPGYQVRACGCEPVVAAGPIGIATDFGLDELVNADTVIVPGRNDATAAVRDDVVVALKSAHRNGSRIASICSGAFTLAAAGLLDGKRATTHWLAAELFSAAYPAVRLDADALYVDEGQILTSAGASAGMDLCLHMVAEDYGSAVAADAARLAVAPLHRTGGQAQFIIRNRRQSHTELDGLLVWIEHNAHLPLTLADIADYASTSVRTLNRRFRSETGQTPMQWVNGVRIRHAQALLEATSDSVETISGRVGFSSAANFREQFRRLCGVAPQSYRNTFRDKSRSVG